MHTQPQKKSIEDAFGKKNSVLTVLSRGKYLGSHGNKTLYTGNNKAAREEKMQRGQAQQ